MQDTDKYEAFLQGLKLISVGLRKCSASVDRDGLHAMWDAKKPPVRNFKDKYAILYLGENYFDASGSFIATVSDAPDGPPLVNIECEFEAHLHGPTPLNKVFVERFVGSAFKLIVIPYARQFVTSVSAQMSIPPLVVPLSIESSKDTERDAPKKSRMVRAKTK